jgi:hypothetical protein
VSSEGYCGVIKHQKLHIQNLLAAMENLEIQLFSLKKGEFWEAFFQYNVLGSQKPIKVKFLTYPYKERFKYCKSVRFLDNN